MPWDVEFDEAFGPEFLAFPEDVQDALLAVGRLLGEYGPQLGRPHVDTLKGSQFANMKELMASGGRPLPSIPIGLPSCWWPVTSPVLLGSASTDS